MGRGFVLFITIFLSQTVFFHTAFALDSLRCAGVLSGVHPLGGDTPVVQVEKILEMRGLARYANGRSVQQLLKQSNRFGLIAVRDEEVVGFLVAEKKGNYLAVETIAVAPTRERSGVGRELIERLAEDGLKMVGIDEIRALVAYDDQGARSFFEAMGLTQTEVIPGRFDGQTVSGVLMKKRIKTEGPAPQLQLQVAVAKPKLALKLETLAVSREELFRLDPVLAQSLETEADEK